ncbi:MAG: methyltransferase family protein [Chloroflexota bacterium]
MDHPVRSIAARGDSDWWRVGIDKRKPGQLVTHGAFAFSRNPIFLFIDLYFVGTFLLNGHVFFLLAALLVVVGLHYQILQEEQFLSQRYGKTYQAYQSQIRRYFGAK